MMMMEMMVMSAKGLAVWERQRRLSIRPMRVASSSMGRESLAAR